MDKSVSPSLTERVDWELGVHGDSVLMSRGSFLMPGKGAIGRLGITSIAKVKKRHFSGSRLCFLSGRETVPTLLHTPWELCAPCFASL